MSGNGSDARQLDTDRAGQVVVKLETLKIRQQQIADLVPHRSVPADMPASVAERSAARRQQFVWWAEQESQQIANVGVTLGMCVLSVTHEDIVGSAEFGGSAP